MGDAAECERRLRFLHPRHALAEYVNISWQASGAADTPGEDAHCRLCLAVDAGGGAPRLIAAGFAAFGPPVVIACADWVCEHIGERTIAAARSLSAREVERALALVPEERYAALLVIDALAGALDNLPG
jgi:hypothetical protein